LGHQVSPPDPIGALNVAWRRIILEGAVWAAGSVAPASSAPPANPRSIFILRNNDLGDLLVVTPLFDALRRRFPEAAIAVGVGAWNADTLQGNPNVTETIIVNAPWHNRITGTRSARATLGYVARSPEVRALRARRFDVGIDVLGSPLGSLLLMRAGIPWRLGVHGYAGGHTAVQQYVHYNPREHVARSALRFAELLGATDLPAVRPQVFLTASEIDDAERLWNASGAGKGTRRIVVAPGGGHPGRAWPARHFVELARRLREDPDAQILAVGSEADTMTTAQIAAHRAIDVAGRLTLRRTMAAISRANLVFCNSSVAMHVAAAFGVPAIVLLGEQYESASGHAAQWGYGPLTRVLGRDDARSTIYEPAEVIAAAESLRAAAVLSPG
jgi:heptosyltransferase-2